MKPETRFAKQDKAFWACVRSLSQHLGYTERGADRIKRFTIDEMQRGLSELGLNTAAVADSNGAPTHLGQVLQDYFAYRAKTLEDYVSRNLLDAKEARELFERYRKQFKPKCPLPMNKQKGTMKAHAYLTGLVNMMVEKHANGAPCDYDPRKLTTVTKAGVPLRTLARRVDGAFPNSVNPIAIWEVKEYYYTTTFGSRVADGVYESLLDGLELEELRDNTGIDIKHYLIVDARDTWWRQGKAYLCRIIDMLNMGYVDEVLFGKEVVQELPRIVGEWLEILSNENDSIT